MNVIAALMKVYAPVAALLLAVAAVWAWTHPLAGGFATDRPSAAVRIEPRIFQLVFGYFAFAGLMGVEWGAAVRDRRDVRNGGWLGILAGGTVTALSALVLGASDSGVPTTSDALELGPARGVVPGRGLIERSAQRPAATAAGLLLLLFGLAALAPACYGSAIYSTRFRAHWPLMQKRAGLWLGCVLVFGLGATAFSAELETIFTISGALFAPLAGVMLGEAVMSRRRVAGPRLGWRPKGVAAWSLGVLVGLAPVLQRLTGASALESIEPAALLAYLTAVFVYLAASLLGPKAAGVAVDRSETSGDA